MKKEEKNNGEREREGGGGGQGRRGRGRVRRGVRGEQPATSSDGGLYLRGKAIGR